MIFLGTDLDCDNFNIKNVGSFETVPPGVVATDDPRLTDQRSMLSGSVTDKSVAATAAIDQSKLSLNGTIPGSWLGQSGIQAAKGNLVQFKSVKDAVNGYPSLDSNGRLNVTALPSTGPGAGTVTFVGLSLPTELTINVSIGGFAVAWSNQPNNSWFGVNGPVGMGGSLVPSFLTKQLPIGLIPNLSATVFTTGIFSTTRLPVVIGMGGSHAKGLVPDPGDGTSNANSDVTSDVTDYLARDGQWTPMRPSNSIQPDSPQPNVKLLGYYRGLGYIGIFSTLRGSSLFYKTGIGGTYIPAASSRIVILVTPGNSVYAYAAKAGYNNSQIRQFTVPGSP